MAQFLAADASRFGFAEMDDRLLSSHPDLLFYCSKIKFHAAQGLVNHSNRQSHRLKNMFRRLDSGKF